MGSMKRTKLEIDYNSKTDTWMLKQNKEIVAETNNKADILPLGRDLGNDIHDNGGLAHLIVKKMDHTIQTEHTYGNDPRKTKG